VGRLKVQAGFGSMIIDMARGAGVFDQRLRCLGPDRHLVLRSEAALRIWSHLAASEGCPVGIYGMHLEVVLVDGVADIRGHLSLVWVVCQGWLQIYPINL
jgi:hypothetical protein